MPGAMRKMGIYLGLVEDDEERHGEEYEEYDSYADEPELEPASVRSVERTPVPRRESFAAEHRAVQRDRSAASAAAPTQSITAYRITTLHPRTYNEARSIGEHFREGVPVIMNLTEMDDADAKRLVDFAAGLTFGLHGRLERVTAKVFLLSPHNVTVTAQDKAKIENGFFNQS
jgi:cell division inhibitor SepF